MGYAHRDVKPHNVLVDPEGHLKVRLKGGGGGELSGMRANELLFTTACGLWDVRQTG